MLSARRDTRSAKSQRSNRTDRDLFDRDALDRAPRRTALAPRTKRIDTNSLSFDLALDMAREWRQDRIEVASAE